QLANGLHDDAPLPTPVLSLPPVATMELGANHTCAIVTDGRGWCCGGGGLGQLGDGYASSRAAQALVTHLQSLSTVALGEEHTCATAPGGLLACWGSDR